MGLYPPVSHYMQTLKEHNVQGRRVALIQSGSWAIASGKLILAQLESMKNMQVAQPVISVLSSAKEEQCDEFDALCQSLLGGDNND